VDAHRLESSLATCESTALGVKAVVEGWLSTAKSASREAALLRGLVRERLVALIGQSPLHVRLGQLHSPQGTQPQREHTSTPSSVIYSRRECVSPDATDLCCCLFFVYLLTRHQVADRRDTHLLSGLE
jgi:hypothetical protein